MMPDYRVWPPHAYRSQWSLQGPKQASAGGSVIEIDLLVLLLLLLLGAYYCCYSFTKTYLVPHPSYLITSTSYMSTRNTNFFLGTLILCLFWLQVLQYDNKSLSVILLCSCWRESYTKANFRTPRRPMHVKRTALYMYILLNSNTKPHVPLSKKNAWLFWQNSQCTLGRYASPF